MKMIWRYKRILLTLIFLTAGILILSKVPSDEHYLKEQAQLNALKQIAQKWQKERQKLSDWQKFVQRRRRKLSFKSPQKSWKIHLHCGSKRCSRRLHWKLKHLFNFEVITASSKSSTSSTSKKSASRPTQKSSFSEINLHLKTKIIQYKSRSFLSRLWNYLRPTKGKLLLRGRLTWRWKEGQKLKEGNWQSEGDYKIINWSAVLPPLLAIFFVLLTRQLLPSLFLSLFFGVILLDNGSLPLATYHTLYSYIWQKGIYKEFSFNIIFFSLSLIGMINVCSRSGGIQGLIEGLRRYASTPRSSRLITALLGLAIFFDDYANSIVVGSTMRPLTDRYRVSREKLAYLIDSTAAPVAGIALLSTWIGYEVGLLGDISQNLGLGINGYSLFLSSLPYRFYCWMTLIFLFMGVLLNRDFGPMLEAERRAFEEGKLLRDGAQPLTNLDSSRIDPPEGIEYRWYNALVPILVVLFVGFFGLLYSGGFFEGHSLREALAAANNTRVFLISSLIGSFVAITMSVSQGILTLKEAFKAWFAGAQAILLAIGILIFAWSMGALAQDLGTAYYLISLLKSSLHPAWVPLLIFVTAALISFATGTSWGTMGILLPTAAPLAFSVGGLPVLILSVGAVLDGSIFGDHCSPLSDTTLFSSTAASCDHVDHVKTQTPYALTVMLVASFFGYLAVSYGWSIYLSIFAAFFSFLLIFFLVGQPTNLSSSSLPLE